MCAGGNADKSNDDTVNPSQSDKSVLKLSARGFKNLKRAVHLLLIIQENVTYQIKLNKVFIVVYCYIYSAAQCLTPVIMERMVIREEEN